MNPPHHVPRLVVSAPASGQGKTTAAAALIGLARAAGLRVAPFKAGPDYLDPTHLARAAGRPARNLDSWLLPKETLLALFQRAATGANAVDLAVVEGMMGLFDGFSGSDDTGSTADTARTLDAPVVLVLDASAAARTSAAVASGLANFDPRTRIAGVIFNRVAGSGHFEMLRDALESVSLQPLGWIPEDPALAVPERNLGLVLAGEHTLNLTRLVAAARETIDLEAVLVAARSAPALPPVDPIHLPEDVAADDPVVIAVARDEAFGFYYEDNLDLLRAAGAELRFFSPLEDSELPEPTDAIYLGGGYPELHAERLFVNLPMRRAIRTFAERGGPVYAECGGLMYLSRELVDADGRRHRMVGLVDAVSRMEPRVRIGYRDVVALRDSPIMPAGSGLRAHEFHFSTLDRPPEPAAYRRRDGAETEGVVTGAAGNVLASYLHVHFASDSSLASRFVASADRFRASRS
jgi:cobyrinic acid a,c-diamide synthase